MNSLSLAKPRGFKVLIASTNQADHDLVEKRFGEAGHKVFHIFSSEELNAFPDCPMHLVIVGGTMVPEKPLWDLVRTSSVLVFGVEEFADLPEHIELRISYRLTDKTIDHIIKQAETKAS
jgi:hypothetical protein